MKHWYCDLSHDLLDAILCIAFKSLKLLQYVLQYFGSGLLAMLILMKITQQTALVS